jgi:hypothetical protein
MSFRILNFLTKPGKDFNLHVEFSRLYPAFIERMRRQYGTEIEASEVDLSTSDPQAFNMWGMPELLDTVHDQKITADPEDRRLQEEFWKSYIGTDAKRLAYAFGVFFLPAGIYESDPTPFVENKIHVETLRNLLGNVSADDTMTEQDRKEIMRLHRLLDGDFKNGIGINNLDDDRGTSTEEIEEILAQD